MKEQIEAICEKPLVYSEPVQNISREGRLFLKKIVIPVKTGIHLP
jgi:hypothetical protein